MLKEDIKIGIPVMISNGFGRPKKTQIISEPFLYQNHQKIETYHVRVAYEKDPISIERIYILDN